MTVAAAAAGNAAGVPDKDPFPPKKIVMAKPAAYSPLTYLDRVKREEMPRLAFAAKNAGDAGAWRGKLRATLWELLGETHTPGASKPQGRQLETKSFDAYTQEKWESMWAGPVHAVYVLRPKSGPHANKAVSPPRPRERRTRHHWSAGERRSRRPQPDHQHRLRASGGKKRLVRGRPDLSRSASVSMPSRTPSGGSTAAARSLF